MLYGEYLVTRIYNFLSSSPLVYFCSADWRAAVDLDCEYSEDSGATWYPATVSGASGVRGSGSVTWKRLSDIPTVFGGSRIFFRATPCDDDPGEAGQIEIPLQPAEVPEIEIEGDGE